MSEQIIELVITGLTAQGEGVGRHQGLAVFVAGGLPGEIVQARLTQVKKKYARAELVEISQKSPARALPVCPHYADCGGCALQHLTYEEQLIWKRGWLADALSRIGCLDVDVLPTLAAQQPFYYRNRVQLHAFQENNQLQLGFFARGGKKGAVFTSCRLIHPLLNELAQRQNAELPRLGADLGGLRHAALRCDSDGDKAALVLVGLPPSLALCELAARLMEGEPRLVSVWANWGAPVYGIYGGSWQKLAGADKLPDRFDSLKLEISPAAFTQVNPTQAQLLYQRVAAYAELSGKETLLDIYSGIGIIALYLARQARRVIGVEEYALAAADAARNAELNGLVNCRFEAGRAEAVLPRLAREGLAADAVVLDPPRAGCAPEVVEAVAAMRPRRIVYVSCDPATLARDLRLFKQLDYAARQVQPVDMFPQTGHVEAVTLLTKSVTSPSS